MHPRVIMASVAAAAALVAAATIIPGVASGNARDTAGTGTAAVALQTPLVALLSGANEVPAADLQGSGAAAITVDATTGEICYDASVANMGTPVAGHIHQGAAGVNGPVVVPFPTLPAADSSVSNCTMAAPALAAQILATPAGFYVNFHSAAFPGGAIRGQLAAGPAPAGPTHFLATPLRAYDSRLADGPLAAGATRTVSLQTGTTLGSTTPELAVPPGATGAIVTLTVTETVSGGFVKLYSAAIAEPATSSINWSQSGQNLAVNTPVAIDGAGRVKITGGVNPTQVVIDVVGYYF